MPATGRPQRGTKPPPTVLPVWFRLCRLRMKLSFLGPLRSVGLCSDSRHAEVGAPAPQAALLQGRGVPRPRPHPGPLPQAGEGDRRSGRRSGFARACLQRCGQAGRGARGRRRACVLRGAACTQCTLRELTRRRRAQRAQRAELSGRRAPRSAQARGVGPQGRPPPSRVAAGLPAPLSHRCTHVCFEVARPTATGRERAMLTTTFRRSRVARSAMGH
jgi:hypothetical protein